MNKTMTRSILALIACSMGWLSSAMAQPNETAADGPVLTPTTSLPSNIMRSTGKWTNGVRLVEPQDYISQPTLPASSLPQFKLTEPAWIGMLNMAGQIAASVRLEPSPYGVSGKLGQSTPQLNSPVPRVD